MRPETGKRTSIKRERESERERRRGREESPQCVTALILGELSMCSTRSQLAIKQQLHDDINCNCN